MLNLDFPSAFLYVRVGDGIIPTFNGKGLSLEVSTIKYNHITTFIFDVFQLSDISFVSLLAHKG